MTHDSSTTTTTNLSTDESTVSSIYHEKRVKNADRDSNNRTGDSTEQQFPVRDVYVTENALHIIIDVDLTETAVTIPLPLDSYGEIQTNAFNLPSENPYSELITFLQTQLNNNPQALVDLHAITGELTDKNKKLKLTADSTTGKPSDHTPFSLTDPVPEPDRESIDPAVNVLSIIAQYYANGKRGIKTRLQNYTESTDTPGVFSLNAPLTPTQTTTFTFNVNTIDMNPEEDPITRFIETAGQGEPTFIPGTEVILLHITDAKRTDGISHQKYIATSDDKNWVFILPEDHNDWSTDWLHTHTDDDSLPLNSSEKLRMIRSGTVIFLTGIIVHFAASTAFPNASNTVTDTLATTITMLAVGIMMFGVFIAITGIAGILLFQLGWAKQYFRKRQFTDHTNNT